MPAEGRKRRRDSNPEIVIQNDKLYRVIYRANCLCRGCLGAEISKTSMYKHVRDQNELAKRFPERYQPVEKGKPRKVLQIIDDPEELADLDAIAGDILGRRRGNDSLECEEEAEICEEQDTVPVATSDIELSYDGYDGGDGGFEDYGVEMAQHYVFEMNKPDLVHEIMESGDERFKRVFLKRLNGWIKNCTPMSQIDEELDHYHEIISTLPDKNKWERTIRQSNPRYSEVYACEDHHAVYPDSFKNQGCEQVIDDSETKCAKPLEKCTRYNSIVDVLQRKLHDSRFSQGLMHGPTFDYAREVEQGKCSSVWSGEFVMRMREKYPDFFDLSSHIPLLFGIFVDGFSPFNTTVNSMGSITLICLNLPASIRMNFENLQLLMLMDGPHEPSNFQIYLAHIVRELKLLWNPFTIDGKTYRAALACCIQDGRAMTKTSLTSEAGSRYGCSKCTVEGDYSNRKYAYSSRGNLSLDDPRRTDSSFGPALMSKIHEPKTHGFLTIRSQYIASGSNIGDSVDDLFLCGVKGQSVFCDLPYWDAGECHLVCFMHNMKNVGKRIEQLALGKYDTIDLRNKLRELGIKQHLWTKHKTEKDGRRKEVLPKASPDWALKLEQENAIFNRNTAAKALNSTQIPSSSCIQPQRFFRSIHKDMGNVDSGENSKLKKGEKLVGEAVPMKQFLLSGAMACVLYYGGAKESFAVSVDRLFSLLGRLAAPIVDMKELASMEAEIWQRICDLEKEIPPSEVVLSIHNLGHLAHQVKMFGPLSETWAYPLESYLGHLKRKAKNKAKPEASIFSRHTYEETIRLLICYLNENNEHVPYDCQRYSDKLTVSGKSRNRELTNEEIMGMRNYIQKNWRSYRTLQEKLHCEDPWLAGVRMTPSRRSQFAGKERQILEGVSRFAQSYSNFVIFRTRFSSRTIGKNNTIVLIRRGNSTTVGQILDTVKVKVRYCL